MTPILESSENDRTTVIFNIFEEVSIIIIPTTVGFSILEVRRYNLSEVKF